MDFSKKSQILMPKNLTSSSNKMLFDIKALLELLHINNDVNAQVKLFSALSAYLMSNVGADIEELITYNCLYDKMCNILSNCPPRKAKVMFNFISALLYTVDEDNSKRKRLTVYARNMIRSSGCLAIMCELFTSCMMHQDTWCSLCQCIAEVCRNIEANQSYCTHLVPVCVQKCSQRNLEVFLVLQNLLQNHERNTSLFIECNGICLFQREYLQHDVCLQLLSTLVQNSTRAVKLLNNIGISQLLREFLNTCGPQSQIGQWATIILYYITAPKESLVMPIGHNQMTDNKPTDKELNKSAGRNVDLEFSTDTTAFFQNVMKEIVYCSPPSDLNYLQSLLPKQPFNKHKANIQPSLFQSNLKRNMIKIPEQNINRYYCFPQNIQNESRRNKVINNVSYSLLQTQNNTTQYDTADKITDSLQRTIHTNLINSRRSTNTNQSITINVHNIPDINNFKPKFASTPKKNPLAKRNRMKTQTRNNTQFTQYNKRERKIQRVVKKKIQKSLEQSISKENKHRSVSGWLFETINESCTTLVKTVKNIFRPKVSLEETKEKSSSDKNSSTCRYSFTNYMRKRDAMLENECTKKSNDSVDVSSVELPNSCNTCNDTIVLKQKLANDEYLKQTVRKLKLGINLYGCDFKKISRQLWPQQSYMTPVVLYNLYRKLIVK